MDTGIIVAIVVYAFFFSLGLGAYSAAPWVPTKRRDRDSVAKAVTLKPGAKVYDLGCGDGVMLFALVDAHPGIRAIGYEIALPPIIVGWIRKLLGGAKYRNVSLRWRDFWGRDFADADAVFVFLMAPAYAKLLPIFTRDLRDDAIVILECWPFVGVPHDKKLGGDGDTLPMYVYSGATLRANQKSSV